MRRMRLVVLGLLILAAAHLPIAAKGRDVRGYVLSEWGNFHPTRPTTLVPKIYVYPVPGGYSVKSGFGDWALVVLNDADAFPQAAENDPRVIWLCDETELYNEIPSGMRGLINGKIVNQTDLVTRIEVGDSWKTFLIRVGQELGHSEEFWLGISGG
jgi:hypothetical protein